MKICDTCTKKDLPRCDIEQEGNCSYEDEKGCLGCVHNVNEDEFKILD